MYVITNPIPGSPLCTDSENTGINVKLQVKQEWVWEAEVLEMESGGSAHSVNMLSATDLHTQW